MEVDNRRALKLQHRVYHHRCVDGRKGFGDAREVVSHRTQV